MGETLKAVISCLNCMHIRMHFEHKLTLKMLRKANFDFSEVLFEKLDY